MRTNDDTTSDSGIGRRVWVHDQLLTTRQIARQGPAARSSCVVLVLETILLALR
jgi:hypothetical protein